TPPCVMAPDSAMLEMGLAGWSTYKAGSLREHDLNLGATELRYGIAPQLEMELSWAGLTFRSIHEGGTPLRQRATDVGDISIGALYGLMGKDGPVAIQGFVTLPTGSGAATGGTWSGGVRLPMAASFGGNWQFGVTPEFDLAANGSGHGRHSAYGGAAGISRPLSDTLSGGLDISLFHDEDPEESSTQSITTASVAWQADSNTQFDIGAGLGLTHSSPRAQFYIGFARRL
ncbi:MAG: hypothetical protein RIQ68_1382, partial [Pseudomonadota bacterium]